MPDPNYVSEIEREDGTILTIKDAEARAAIDGMDPTLQQILQGVNDIKSSIGDVGEIVEEVLVGPPTLIEKTITENGTYDASDDEADGYSSVTVDVANSYSQADNGKVVYNGALVSQTAYPTTVTQNDTYDTTNCNSITVNVSGGSSSAVAICTFTWSNYPFILEDENETIGDYAFSSCDTLTSITISNSATSIGEHAFSSCIALETVTFEANSTLETIGDYAFYECDPLSSITIPNSVTSIGDNAFQECGLSSITIPNSVTSIGESAFQECVRLTSITIPDSVTSIGGSAFSGCEYLETVTFEANSNLETIGAYMFYGCYALTSITIPNSVTSIGDGTFGECSALTSIAISNSVTSIGDSAFSNCDSLETITFEPTTPPDLGGDLGLPTTCTIRVPQGTLSDYTSADYYPDPSEYIYEEY